MKEQKEEQEQPKEEKKVVEDGSVGEYDFDFSIYEQEQDDEEQETEAAVLKEAPNVQIYRSRWSNWDGELQRLTEINKEISKQRSCEVSVSPSRGDSTLSGH